MSELRRETSLTHVTGNGSSARLAIEMTEIGDRGMIDLRGRLEQRKFGQAVKSVLGVDLPKVPRTSVSKGDVTVLWLSIDQWLVCCPYKKTAKLLGDLKKALDGIHSLAVDMSDARTIIRLTGNGVREIMMKGAPVDFLAPDMIKGTVRRLRFGELAAMVHIADDRPDTFDLYVFRSYAEYAWKWLDKTATQASAVRLFGSQDCPPV